MCGREGFSTNIPSQQTDYKHFSEQELCHSNFFIATVVLIPCPHWNSMHSGSAGWMCISSGLVYVVKNTDKHTDSQITDISGHSSCFPAPFWLLTEPWWVDMGFRGGRLSCRPGSPGGSEGKESACNSGDLSTIPGSGSSPGEGNDNPLQYSGLDNPMDRGAWWATVHGGHKRVQHNWATNTLCQLPPAQGVCCVHVSQSWELHWGWSRPENVPSKTEGRRECQLGGGHRGSRKASGFLKRDAHGEKSPLWPLNPTLWGGEDSWQRIFWEQMTQWGWHLRKVDARDYIAGEGTGTPLQYSCLENPVDGGAWWAAVHGVAKSQTRLSDFTFTFHLHALEKEMATHSSVLTWRIPGTGEPGELPSVGSHIVGHDWSDLAAAVAAWLHCRTLN